MEGRKRGRGGRDGGEGETEGRERWREGRDEASYCHCLSYMRPEPSISHQGLLLAKIYPAQWVTLREPTVGLSSIKEVRFSLYVHTSDN